MNEAIKLPREVLSIKNVGISSRAISYKSDSDGNTYKLKGDPDSESSILWKVKYKDNHEIKYFILNSSSNLPIYSLGWELKDKLGVDLSEDQLAYLII